MFGYNAQELEGAKLSILFPDSKIKDIKNNTSDETIHTGKRKNGQPIAVRVKRLNTLYKDRKIQFLALQNMAEEEKAKHTVKEEQEKYHILSESILDAILFINPSGKIIYANPIALEMFGYKNIKELQKRHFIDFVLPQFKEKVNLDIQLLSPENKGRLIQYKVQDANKTSFWVETISNKTVFQGENGTLLCLRDITERKLAEEGIKKIQGAMKKVLEEVVSALSKTIAEKDPYTLEHQKKVSELACAIAKKMNLSPEFIDGLKIAAILHDIGKGSIPGALLFAPRKLTDIEMGLVKLHTVKGYNILKDIDFPWPIAKIVLQHHEHIDGSGYPHGIDGKTILLEAKILAVADVVEAINSHRPYRKALGIQAALEEIESKKGLWYDEAVVNACKELFEKGFNF